MGCTWKQGLLSLDNPLGSHAVSCCQDVQQAAWISKARVRGHPGLCATHAIALQHAQPTSSSCCVRICVIWDLRLRISWDFCSRKQADCCLR